jgi:hypothetical protein
MMLALTLAAAAAVATPAATTVGNGNTAAVAAKLRERAVNGESVSYDVLESLTTEIGPRPTGSPAIARAKEWAVAKLKALGFKNVHVEEFTKKNMWQRGPESCALVKPYALPLSILGLGNSGGGAVEGDVVVFTSVDDLVAQAPGSLAGKIVVVNQPMTRTQTGEGYGTAVKARGVGPSLAEQRGAIGYLTRSIATGDARAPHTGATGWGAAPPKIPSAALGVADADLITRLAKRGPVRLSLSMAPTVIPETPAWNVVGEVPGRGKDDDVIVIGGHLDSWDPGQGAVDDGAGVSITIGAAKLVADLPNRERPARTIRVVLFGSEETGGAGEAYAKAHDNEVNKILVAGESDSGAGRVYRVAFPAGVVADPALATLPAALAPIRVIVGADPSRFGGADIDDLHEKGVPIIDLAVDATRYFDIHHSADDTLDKVDRKELEQATAAWAVVLEYLADTGIDLRKPPPPATTPPK